MIRSITYLICGSMVVSCFAQDFELPKFPDAPGSTAPQATTDHNPDGTPAKHTTFNRDGSIKSQTVYTYNERGSLLQQTTTVFKPDGSRTETTTSYSQDTHHSIKTVIHYDADGTVTSENRYESNAKKR